MRLVIFSGLRSADQGRQLAFPLAPGFNLGGMRGPERFRWI
jgi:hypothetical protein